MNPKSARAWVVLGMLLVFLLAPVGTSLAVDDTTAPVLTSLSFPQTPLNVGAGDAQLPVSFAATDDLSGVSMVVVYFESPTGGQIESGASFSSSGVINVTFPQYSISGIWHIKRFTLWDETSNTREYSQAQLTGMGFPTTIELISQSDTTSSSTTASSTTTTLPPTTTTSSTTTTTTHPSSTTSTTDLPPAAFADVTPNHPYYTEIMDLANRQVVIGYGDTFGPNDPVIRQQFAKMIVKTLGLTVTGLEPCPFVDVGKGIGTDPFYPDQYVAVCAQYNITKGKDNTHFAPYENISRQQLITMVARAANLPYPPSSYVPPFSPAQFYPEEHYLNAKKAAYSGLLEGLIGLGPSYSFFDSASRGEVCVLLHNLLHR